jgi:serine/threonine protein kinase
VSVQPFVKPTSELDRRTLGKYELLCRLSTGGMSEIFLATQKGLAGFRKIVVLKSILPDISGEDEFVKMFLEEARTTAAFNHPNIAQVFDLDTDEGTLFLAMEFVQGATLVEMARACRQAKEPIPIGFTLASVRDTALALHYAHNFTDPRGRKQVVIHRDVAEKNIMVTYEGTTKLLDFGIAKALGRRGGSLTSIGMVKGTSGYMSPEQIRGEPLDPRSDVFALGVVLHECLTGMRLFHGKNPEDGMLAALREDVQPPSRLQPEVTPSLDQVTLKALARDRDQRFTTALEFARAIEKAAPGMLWHPEQSGDLVQRFYTERRVQTRELIEQAQGGVEHTGELRLDRLKLTPVATPAVAPKGASDPALARAQKATVPGGSPRVGPPPPPPPPGRNEAKTMVPRNSGEHRVQMATEPSGLDVRLTRAPVQAVGPAPREVTQIESRNIDLNRSGDFDDDDDDPGAKTVPAAALPEELLAQIRANRAKAAADAATRPEAVTAAVSPITGPRPSNVVLQGFGEGRSTTGEQTNTETTGPAVPAANPFADILDSAENGMKTSVARPFDTHADDEDEEPQPEPEASYDEEPQEDEELSNDGDDRYDGEDPGPEPQTNTSGVMRRKGGIGKFVAIGCALAVLTLGVGLYAAKIGPFAATPKATGFNPLPGPIAEFGVKKPKPEAPVEVAKKEPEPSKPVEVKPEPKPEVKGVETKPPEPKPEPKVAEPEPTKKPPVVADNKKPDPPVREKKTRPPPRRRTNVASAAEPKEPAEPPPPAAVGSLSLVVEPPVHAFFGGRDLGQTPLKANLPVGRQTLKLVPASGGAKTVTVEVKETGGAARFDLEDL